MSTSCKRLPYFTSLIAAEKGRVYSQVKIAANMMSVAWNFWLGLTDEDTCACLDQIRAKKMRQFLRFPHCFPFLALLTLQTCME